MERKQYLDQIHELVQTVQTLLDANIALGNKQKEQKAESDRKIAGLQAQVDKYNIPHSSDDKCRAILQ